MKTYSSIERGRIFGKGGDLNFRRDGNRVLWNFIGKNDVKVPAGFGGKNFWESNPDVQLRQHDEAALLWGAYKQGLNAWQEDRVGWAKLNYPFEGAQPEDRVRIKYSIFTTNGQIAFVWWKELENYGK